MPVVLSEIAVDCRNPVLLARFWCEALNYQICEESAGLVTIGHGGADEIPVICFAQVPEAKSVKNRIHLDLKPSGAEQSTEVERLIALGASYIDVGQDEADEWVVLADPEGNEFCVLSGTM